jgi:hypothetical protein
MMRNGDDLLFSYNAEQALELTRTCPPPGTSGVDPPCATCAGVVGISCPFGNVTYVSSPIATMRCLVTFGLLKQNQPGRQR